MELLSLLTISTETIGRYFAVVSGQAPLQLHLGRPISIITFINILYFVTTLPFQINGAKYDVEET
jgi:hypothetical protein